MSIRKVIDHRQVQANIARARHINAEGADFLLRLILDDIEDRLSVTNRTFDRGYYSSFWNDLVSSKLPNLKVLERSNTQLKADEIGKVGPGADLIVDIASLHLANDIPGMLIQYRRALKADGLFLACVPGGDTLHELRQSLFAAESELSGGVHPRVLPFVDVRDAGSLLQRAGFALPVTDIDSITVRYDTMFDLMRELRAMGATNALIDRSKNFSSRKLFEMAARHYAEHFSDLDGRIRATFSFIWLSGWAPAATQPKPLKPGSATHSLAQALKDRSK